MRGYLIDTNVISEWQKPKPNSQCVEFVRALRRTELFISSVCMIELRRGISADKNLTRRNKLIPWAERELPDFFGQRLLPVDEKVLECCIELALLARKVRFSPSFIDMMIASTAKANDLTILTRKVRDFLSFGVPTVNPFTGAGYNGAQAT